MNIPLFDLYLEDGTILKECAIFKIGEDDGYVVIDDRKEAEETLQRYLWGNFWRKIHFQNSMLNGHINGEKLRKYEYIQVLEC